MIQCIDSVAGTRKVDTESLSRDTDPTLRVLDTLADFERQFWYPLGPENSFRIEHGEDYTLFFRAMGHAVTFYEECDGEIRGVISVVLRSLRTPSGESVRAAYFCDLKVLASARGGMTAARLLQRSSTWALENVSRAYCVVMGGTTNSPTRYTGRLGIPEFKELSQFAILRIPISGPVDADESVVQCPLTDLSSQFASLTAGAYCPEDGNPELRSEMEPCGLINRNGKSCGVLEDTRRAKRLYDRQGSEMMSAHLSSFAFQTPEEGAKLIRRAMKLCRRRDIPAIFLAISLDHSKPLLAALGIADVVQAQATVFGHGLPATGQWCVSTSEI